MVGGREYGSSGSDLCPDQVVTKVFGPAFARGDSKVVGLMVPPVGASSPGVCPGKLCMRGGRL